MRYKEIIALVPGAIGIIGCAVPQNTVLFATNTSIALDLSVNPTTGTPNIIIGYKRQEGVIMPLLASRNVYPHNGISPTTVAEGDADTPDDTSGDALLCTVSGHADNPCVFRGSGAEGMDTYSVLATVGADTNANVATGTSATTGAGVSVSQFFATGLAARELARTGGAALVNTNATAPGAISPAALKAVADLESRQDSNIAKISQRVVTFPDDRDSVISAAMPALDAPTAAYLKTTTTKNQFLAALQSDYVSTSSIAAGIR